MRIEVLNGANLNVLGRRDPAVYGGMSLNELERRIYEWASELGCIVRCRQTNSEGEYIEWCHKAFDDIDALIVNPGAWTHYSYALHDALEAVEVPKVEVHLSNVHAREEWRRRSVVSSAVDAVVAGMGARGYVAAVGYLLSRYGER